MADRKYIKDIMDKQMNNVYVTQQLREKTLKRCNKNNNYDKIFLFNRNLGTAIAAVFVLIIFVGSYIINLGKSNESNHYANRVITNNKNTNISKIQVKDKLKNKEVDEVKGDRKIEPQKKTQENNKQQRQNKINNFASNMKNPIIQKKNIKILKPKKVKEIAKNKDIKINKQKELLDKKQKVEEKEIDLKVKDVERFWGNKVEFPTYIPEGYEVYDLVACNDKDEKSIRIIYKKEDSYFEVKQIKEPINNNKVIEVEEEKKISQPKEKKNISIEKEDPVKNEKKEEKGNINIEQKEQLKNEKKEEKNNINKKDNNKESPLDIKKNGIYYNVKGTVSKDVLEKVIDSID